MIIGTERVEWWASLVRNGGKERIKGSMWNYISRD